MEIKYRIHRSVFTGLYHTTLLGGEFANCHGQGETRELAVISLKLTLNAMRREKIRGQSC
jgi:hypothetical protein